MLKGCIPDAKGAEAFYSIARRRKVRRVYLAMIAEFDAMVGEYIRAVDDAQVYTIHYAPCTMHYTLCTLTIHSGGGRCAAHGEDCDYRHQVCTIHYTLCTMYYTLYTLTVIIVTSDHGDMDMEQQQFYKMVPYEASTRYALCTMHCTL
jgi:hypothetical protein